MKPVVHSFMAMILCAAAFGPSRQATAGEKSGPAGVAAPAPGAETQPSNLDQLKAIQPPDGWVQCKKCKRYHQPSYICCCPTCGSLHPKDLKCRVEKTAPRREATCPACGKRFNGVLPFGQNIQGGCDRDFCTHSVGSSVVASVVWMCPRCGYASFCPAPEAAKDKPAERDAVSDFNKPLSAEAVRAVRARVEPLFKKRVADMAGKHSEVFEELDQTDIPDWFKYEMALESADARGASAAEKAKFALEGSYSCRRMLVAPVSMQALSAIIVVNERAVESRGGQADNPASVIKAIRDMFSDSEVVEEQEKKRKPAENATATKNPIAAQYRLSEWDKFCLRLRLAGAYDRLGDREMAAESLKQAEDILKTIRLEQPEQLKPFMALVAEHRRFLEKESVFRARAVTEMRQALLVDNAYPGAAAAFNVYMLGELYRRQGDNSHAKTWLTLAGKLSVKLPTLAAWADEALGMPGVKRADVDPAEETAAVAFVEKLTGKKVVLDEPKTTKPVPEAVAGPKTCADCMGRISAAYAAYLKKNTKPPAKLQDLVDGGFITEEAAGGFRCPETGVAYRYTADREAKGEAMILFHSDPRKTACKKCLYANGTVRELE